MNFLLSILVTAVSVLIAGKLLPGVHVSDFWTACVVALVLAFLNSVVKPVFVLLTLPITVVTLGLFLLVINVLLIYAASGLVDGFRVDGFITALLFSIIISIGRGLGDALLSSKKDKE